jgi:hypothetical protein
MISIEQSEETGLSSSRALHTPEAEVVAYALKIPQIPKELLDPKGRPLPNSRQLRRLEVGEAERGQVAVLRRKCRQTRDEDTEGANEVAQSLTEEDEICVASGRVSGFVEEGVRREVIIHSLGDIAGRRAEMDDARSSGCDNAKGVHVCHDVVPALLLLDGGYVELFWRKILVMDCIISEIKSESDVSEDSPSLPASEQSPHLRWEVRAVSPR